MNTSSSQRTASSIINVHELAYMTGSEPGAIRRAGAALFTSLAGRNPDLSVALIAASEASGVEPRHVLSMMKVLADEFNGSDLQQVRRDAVDLVERHQENETTEKQPGRLAAIKARFLKEREGEEAPNG